MTPAPIQMEALKPNASLRILPAGKFRARDRRPLGSECWSLTDADASSILKAAAGRKDDFLIDYDHQSLSARESGNPAPAAGWFKRLEWRPGDGLFMAGISWTDKARELIAAREYRYLSPVFSYTKDGTVKDVFNVALTNSPALIGLTDLAATSMNLNCDKAGRSGGVQALSRLSMPRDKPQNPQAVVAAAEVHMALCDSEGRPVKWYEAIRHITSGGRIGA